MNDFTRISLIDANGVGNYALSKDEGSGIYHARFESGRQQFNGTNLCHSIVVCARRPRWAVKRMCSSGMSASNFSRNAVNGRKATASRVCARPSRRLEASAEVKWVKWVESLNGFRDVEPFNSFN